MSTNIAVTKKETVDLVTAKVRQFQMNKEIFFPANYSPENALKSAWLQIQEVVDKDYKAALEVCTMESVANALLSMVIQGLNPDKKQAYFIVYGKKLQMQRSYFGSMAVAKAVNPEIEDIYPEVVYQGDVFKYVKVRGRNCVTTHEQSLENIKKDLIVAAYCTVIYRDGTENTTIMTLEEIKQAWSQSKMKPIDDKGNIKADSTHGKFTAEMAKKTVVNKACKAIINSSDDGSLMARYAKMTDTDTADAEIEEEIAENANQGVIDVSDYENVDIETGEIVEATEPKQEEIKADF